MALVCNAQNLSVASGALAQFNPTEIQALLVLYLYRQKNPTSGGVVVPAASLLASASCLNCGTGINGINDAMMNRFEVWIQRQAAIDAGLVSTGFNANKARAEITPLCNLSMHSLRAIEIYLNCLLS